MTKKPATERTGYSGTPLAQKLGIKPGAAVAVINAPAGFEGAIEGLPADVRVERDPRGKGPYDVVVLFVTSAADLRRRFGPQADRLASTGGLWIAWPKKASGVATDITENGIREHGLKAGFVDNKVCAIDQTWSGLRFVYRLKDR